MSASSTTYTVQERSSKSHTAIFQCSEKRHATAQFAFCFGNTSTHSVWFSYILYSICSWKLTWSHIQHREFKNVSGRLSCPDWYLGKAWTMYRGSKRQEINLSSEWNISSLVGSIWLLHCNSIKIAITTPRIFSIFALIYQLNTQHEYRVGTLSSQ